MTFAQRILVALLPLLLAGCGGLFNPHVDVVEPTTARPSAAAAIPIAPVNGAIFNVASYRPAFEDRRARFVGDTLVIALNEKLNASKKASSNAERTHDASMNIPIIKHLPFKSLQHAEVIGTSDYEFESEGETENSNLFTGTITVTVVEVLPNGNLLVSGEKQIGITKNTETLRFSGVVNPITIMPGNVVSSTQVADARIDYRSAGYIDEAQAMGWMGRFFLNFLPF